MFPGINTRLCLYIGLGLRQMTHALERQLLVCYHSLWHMRAHIDTPLPFSVSEDVQPIMSKLTHRPEISPNGAVILTLSLRPQTDAHMLQSPSVAQEGFNNLWKEMR